MSHVGMCGGVPGNRPPPMRLHLFEDFPNCDMISQSVLEVAVSPKVEFVQDDGAGPELDKLFLEEVNDLPSLLPSFDTTPLPDFPALLNCCTKLTAVNGCTAITASSQDIPREINKKGLRPMPHPHLHAAGQGKEKVRSENNNRWALKRADDLRSGLGWDMRIAFGDLPLQEVDLLLSELFARVVKVDGSDYPAESLSNMLGGFNRILRRASNVRSLKGEGEPLGRDFCIKKHPQFARTRMVLDAAIKKTAADGINKKRKKVMSLTECHEVAILVDYDHQNTHNQGCQKRLVFYLLCRCGIRGGGELWLLKRIDLCIMTDREGREFVRFEERHSKNNGYDINHTKEEQMRETYHSYEEDFVFSVKQYLRHLPPMADGVSDALLLRPIQGPAGNIWYNRVFKVSKEVAAQYLRTMLTLVGLPAESIVSNKSGRTTLITRMCAKGIPDHIGQLVTGHHTQDAYQRYDRTKDLKMKAAIEATANPGLNYTLALDKVSKEFVQEHLIGSSEGLKPLVARVNESASAGSCFYLEQGKTNDADGLLIEEALTKIPSQVAEQAPNDAMKVGDLDSKFDDWSRHYDGIDWELALKTDPRVRSALGAQNSGSVCTIGSSGNGSTFSGNFTGCTINVFPNFPPRLIDGKENESPAQ